MNAAHRTTTIGLVLTGLLLFTAAGRCDETPGSRFSLGVGIGAGNVSDDTVFIEDNSAAYKALFGYHVNEVFSVEGTAIALDDFVAINPFVADPQRVVANASGINASAVLRWPIAGRVDAMARAGVLFWQADTSFGQIEESGSDLSFGIGFAVRLTDALSLRAEYDAFEISNVDVAVATASLVYRFGASRR